MLGSWITVFAAVTLVTGTSGSAPSIDRASSTICASGSPRDQIQVRVFPITIQRRVFPSPDEIIDHGGSASMVRQFWRLAMAGICDPNLPEADARSAIFEARIVVFVEGERDRSPLLLEYPDWQDTPAPVRARLNGRTVLVPAAVVRKLLDYSRVGWRD